MKWHGEWPYQLSNTSPRVPKEDLELQRAQGRGTSQDTCVNIQDDARGAKRESRNEFGETEKRKLKKHNRICARCIKHMVASVRTAANET